MKVRKADVPLIQVAIIESDPLRTIGFHAMLDSQREFNLIIESSCEAIPESSPVDVALLGEHAVPSIQGAIFDFRMSHPRVPILIVGAGINDESILNALSAGAKGYVGECASTDELVKAIRTVSQGSTWAPRRVLSQSVDQANAASGRALFVRRRDFTPREKQVLGMLVAGKSNKEIAEPLGIEERTVKAHVAKLLRKVGVQNRVRLTVEAVTQSLVPAKYV